MFRSVHVQSKVVLAFVFSHITEFTKYGRLWAAIFPIDSRFWEFLSLTKDADSYCNRNAGKGGNGTPDPCSLSSNRPLDTGRHCYRVC